MATGQTHVGSLAPIGAAGRGPSVRPPAFESAWPIVAAAIAGGALVGLVLTRDLQLGVAFLAGLLFLPLALLNLPLAVIAWIPLAYLESWPAARFVPLGVAALIALAWLGSLGTGSAIPSGVLARHRGTFLLLAIFLTWLTVSIAWAPDPGEGGGEIWTWYVSAAVFFVIATTLSTGRHLVAACAGVVVVGLFAIVVAVPQLAAEGAQTEEAARLGGSLQNPNYLASELLIAIVLAVGLMAVVRGSALRWLLAGAAGVMLAGLLLTGSRGGLVAALTAAAAAVVLVRGRRFQIAALLTSIAVIGGLAVANLSQESVDRVREFDGGGSGRVDLWAVAWEMSKDNPAIGVGLNNFRVESPDYVQEAGALEHTDLVVETPKLVHNAYLEFLAETGAIGLALFLLLMVAILRATWLGARQLDDLGDGDLAALARAILVAQVGALVALIFLSNPGNDPLWALLALGPVTMTIAELRARGAARV